MSKSIEKQFVRHNLEYKQMNRDGAVCLYSYKAKRGKSVLGYEVVKLYTDPRGQEYFPGSSLWGIKGWTFTARQLEDAQTKFKTVVAEMKIPKRIKRVVTKKKKTK